MRPWVPRHAADPLGRVYILKPGTQMEELVPAETVWEQHVLVKGRGTGRFETVSKLGPKKSILDSVHY